ncbi:MAG: hypothetical protein ACR2L6_08165 [Gemmatimonadaceae bacterium]
MSDQSSRPRQARTRKAAIAVLAGSMASIGVAYAAAIVTGATSTWSAWVIAIATSFAMVATMALGAARTGQPLGGLRGLLLPFAAVLLILLGAFAAALLLPAANEPLLLGLPRRAAIVLYGVGVLPVLILPVAYALTFDELTLTEEDIERVREAASRAQSEARE